MSTKLLSIIVPVFNGKAFIVDSLYSLMSQASPAIEVIVVDDGSQDNTVDLIKEHFGQSLSAQQLVLCTQQNQGVSVARNHGITKAKGAYIGFMDGDDLVQPHYFSTLLKAIEKKPDVIEFGFKTFAQSIEETYKKPALYSNTKFGQHSMNDVMTKVYTTSKWYPWTRLFKKELFHSVHFPVGVKFCEDVMTIPNLYEKAQTIFVLPDALYAYRTNLNSATYKVGPDYVENIVRYYQTIPHSGHIKHDYLRISFAYTIISCQIKVTNDWALPQFIQHDMHQLRNCLPLYWQINPRVLMMLLYPKVFKWLRKWLAR
jgi:glycosyltransferase involved in cell wall biosynthesis